MMDTRSFERGRGEYMGITMNVIMIGNQYLSIVKSYKKIKILQESYIKAY